MFSRIESCERSNAYRSCEWQLNRLAAKLRAEYARKQDFKLDNKEAARYSSTTTLINIYKVSISSLYSTFWLDKDDSRQARRETAAYAALGKGTRMLGTISTRRAAKATGGGAMIITGARRLD